MAQPAQDWSPSATCPAVTPGLAWSGPWPWPAGLQSRPLRSPLSALRRCRCTHCRRRRSWSLAWSSEKAYVTEIRDDADEGQLHLERTGRRPELLHLAVGLHRGESGAHGADGNEADRPGGRNSERPRMRSRKLLSPSSRSLTSARLCAPSRRSHLVTAKCTGHRVCWTISSELDSSKSRKRRPCQLPPKARLHPGPVEQHQQRMRGLHLLDHVLVPLVLRRLGEQSRTKTRGSPDTSPSAVRSHHRRGHREAELPLVGDPGARGPFVLRVGDRVEDPVHMHGGGMVGLQVESASARLIRSWRYMAAMKTVLPDPDGPSAWTLMVLI